MFEELCAFLQSVRPSEGGESGRGSPRLTDRPYLPAEGANGRERRQCKNPRFSLARRLQGEIMIVREEFPEINTSSVRSAVCSTFNLGKETERVFAALIVGQFTKTSRVIQGGMDREEIIKWPLHWERTKARNTRQLSHSLSTERGGPFICLSPGQHPSRLLPFGQMMNTWVCIWSRATALCEQPEHEHAHAHGP